MTKLTYTNVNGYVKESVGENKLSGGLEEQDTEDAVDWEQEADMDAALEFADGF